MEKYMIKFLKNTKGAIALYVLLSSLFFLTVSAGTYMVVNNREQEQVKEIQRIQETYQQITVDDLGPKCTITPNIGNLAIKQNASSPEMKITNRDTVVYTINWSEEIERDTFTLDDIDIKFTVDGTTFTNINKNSVAFTEITPNKVYTLQVPVSETCQQVVSIGKNAVKDKSGNNSFAGSSTIIIDKTIPEIELDKNGDSYVITMGQTQTLTSEITTSDNDNAGKTGLNKMQYAWSTSNTQEPTQWLDYVTQSEIDGSVITNIKKTVTRPGTGNGTYYLWTKATDMIGNKTGSKKSNAFVVKTDISTCNITLDKNLYIYDGTIHKPTVKVMDLSTTLVEGTNYTIAYSSDTKNAGSPTVTITGKGYYTGTKTFTYTINKRALKVKAEAKSKTYGQENPSLKYTYSNYVSGETPMFTGDLTTDATTSSSVGTYEIKQGTLALIDNGSFLAKNYKIEYESAILTINTKDLSGYTATLGTTSYTYGSDEKKPAVTVSDGTKNLTKDVDFTVTYSNNINAGTATVTIKGIGNYKGTITKTFTINKMSVATTWGTKDDFEYNGSAQGPTVTTPVTGAGGERVILTRTTATAIGSSYTSTASISSITGGQALASNYTLTNTTKTFKIYCSGTTDYCSGGGSRACTNPNCVNGRITTVTSCPKTVSTAVSCKTTMTCPEYYGIAHSCTLRSQACTHSCGGTTDYIYVWKCTRCGLDMDSYSDDCVEGGKRHTEYDVWRNEGREFPCTICNGTGTKYVNSTCPICNGTGSKSTTTTCTTCGGDGIEDYTCSHGKSASHYYCSHNQNGVKHY